ncbi:hypothetical protein Pla22_38210 [Rubripirellula amarantea]|uniref:Uncharacterized protein n=1 Tax=Rubripirellula amarantea TaxID=2527999 RepID=A0A5C5WLK1_9BACT|nr:hypothetical protein [Rubripirellula amarantea]TWT51045.1 hypothetical protein Pla22_38210 [Rubripirellula amarantea]
MTRYQFRTDLPYPSRLLNVTRRPIENGSDSSLQLLRFEFEIFVIEESGDRFRSTGKIASRDLIVGSKLDSGVQRYANALDLQKPANLSSWVNERLIGRWVQISFAETDPTDFRNPFASIESLETIASEIVEYEYELLVDWYSVSEVADDLGLSSATVRRKLAALEPKWGKQLVRRTNGGHRRICLPLLRNLL